MQQTIRAISWTLAASVALAGGDSRGNSVPEWTGEVVSTFASNAARQGIGVDADYVYASIGPFGSWRLVLEPEADASKITRILIDFHGQCEKLHAR